MQIHYLTLDKVHIGNIHSPETLLLSILDDFLNKLDNNSNIQLILLDLSAAFDTIDHSILIKHLEDIGIVRIPLAWVRTYLKEHFR